MAAALAGRPRWLRFGAESATMRVFVTSEKQRHQPLPEIVLENHISANKQADEIVVDTGTRFQTDPGFGAALTNASCFLLSQLDGPTRHIC